MGWQWPATELGALSAAVCPWKLLKEIAIIFITCTIVWSQVKQQERDTAWPSTENWSKDLLSTAPPIRTRPSFPHSQSLPSESFCKLLILSFKKPQSEKTNQTDLMDHSLV